jgi:hypothetical protein
MDISLSELHVTLYFCHRLLWEFMPYVDVRKAKYICSESKPDICFGISRSCNYGNDEYNFVPYWYETVKNFLHRNKSHLSKLQSTTSFSNLFEHEVSDLREFKGCNKLESNKNPRPYFQKCATVRNNKGTGEDCLFCSRCKPSNRNGGVCNDIKICIRHFDQYPKMTLEIINKFEDIETLIKTIIPPVSSPDRKSLISAVENIISDDISCIDPAKIEELLVLK